MEVVYERCCGLDVHKRTVVACLLTPAPEGERRQETRTFGTMTDDLLTLADWLAASGCTHVAMEATGAYWKPGYNILEGHFEVLVVNAQHVKAVPGRKTDVRDAEWLADLLQHGLLRGSFIPPRPQRELRDLTRYRGALVQERASEVNHLQKTLEGANLKLASVATDVLGATGRAILEAVVAGEGEAGDLARLAKGSLRQKQAELKRALTASITEHQRLMIREHQRPHSIRRRPKKPPVWTPLQPSHRTPSRHGRSRVYNGAVWGQHSSLDCFDARERAPPASPRGPGRACGGRYGS